MVIRHSLKLLEQLSEIEGLIESLERLMDERGIDFDREQVLLKVLKGRETRSASRPLKKDN